MMNGILLFYSFSNSREDQVSQKIYIQLKDPEKESIMLTLETRDSNELILVLSGYFRLVCPRVAPAARSGACAVIASQRWGWRGRSLPVLPLHGSGWFTRRFRSRRAITCLGDLAVSGSSTLTHSPEAVPRSALQLCPYLTVSDGRWWYFPKSFLRAI